MRIICAFVTVFSILFTAPSQARHAAGQDVLQQRITVHAENETLKDVFLKIQTKIDVRFMYKANDVNNLQKVSVNLTHASLKEVLDRIFKPLLLRYEVIEKNIVVKAEPTAQQPVRSLTTVSGTVTSYENGEAMPGVNIAIKGTTNGSTTDANGAYSVSVESEESVLVFSFIGYTTEEIKVGNQRTVDIKMMPDITQLKDIVVVGYGTAKRSEVLGAISSVSVKESSSRTYNSAAELLQGTVAGVTVLNNGGDPTASPTINIRGIGSINNEVPLIVLDGIIYSGSFNTINPDDIASISVLKDAASAAIYGARASGGVILVTTKKGTSDRVHVNVNYQQGFQQVAKKLEALNAADYADAMNTATDNAGLPRIPAFDVNNEPTARTTKTVWMDEIFRTGKVSNLAVSLDGGSAKSNFFLSGGYRKNEGLLLNTYSERYTARVNSSYKLLPNLTVGENLTYSLTNGQTGNTTSAYTGAILSAIFYPPNATIYREDGSGLYGGVPEKYPGSYGDVINPVAYLNRLDNKNPVSTILINPYAEWNIVKGLTFRSNWGLTRIQDNYKQFNTKITEPGKIFDFNELIQRSLTINDLLAEQTLSYDKTFGKHEVKALAGYTYQETTREGYGILGTGFDNEDPSQRYIINAKTIQQNSSISSQEIINSYLGRISYSYSGKYLLSGIIRRDGTSKLTSNNRWAVYSSVSAGWVITEEPFMQSLSSMVTNLKLRASYGEIGNLGSLRPYQFSVPLSQTSSLLGSSPTINYGYAERELSNSSLVWERSQQSNIGLDFGLLKNRLSGSVDAFVKTNKKMLLTEKLPGVAGTPSGRSVNAGNVENRGLEVALTYKNNDRAIKYDITVNYAHLNNKIVSINGDLPSLVPTDATTVRSLPNANIYKVGSSVYAFYGYKTDGIFKTDDDAAAYVNTKGTKYQANAKAGDFKFQDTNNDGVIDDKDRVVLGTPFPKNTFSLNGNASYKGFDLNFFLQGVSGNSIFNAVNVTGLNGAYPGYNLLSEVKGAWTPQHTDATIPKLSASDPNNNFGRISDFYIEDASFVRLRNLSIGYTLKDKWLKGKAKTRVYVSGQNLFTITRYSGMDPEIGISNWGVDVGRYPLSRIYMAGINVTF